MPQLISILNDVKEKDLQYAQKNVNIMYELRDVALKLTMIAYDI